MKRIFTSILLSILVVTAFAQAPQKLSYQAVIRNTSDQLVANTTVGMQISILQGSATGTVVYSETQTPTTNANGLVSIEIGNGIGFDAIDWSNGPYFIKTETDITGGTIYTISGTSELLSVPYALHAKTAESISGGIIETDPVFDLSAAATITATDIVNWNNKLSTEVDGDVTNEIQILSISNDTIRLTNGGFVKLPAGFDGDYNSLINKPTIPVVPTNVGAFTNDVGYLTSFTEVDGDATNELQILSISNDTIRLTNGGIVKLPAGFDGDYNSLINKPTIPVVPTNVGAFTNDVGYLTSFTEIDGDVTNELQILSISNDTIHLTNGGFVKLPAGFDGDYNSLINTPTIPVVPTTVSAFTNDVGYLTSFTEVDGSITNEIQVLSISNDTIRLTNGGFVKLPAGFDGDYNSLINTPTIPVVPTTVGAFTNDAGYLTSFTEVDGSITNEIQILSISNDTIYLSSGGYVKLPPSNAWTLSGNAGTVDGVNAIGTTDNVPLSFIVNGQKSGKIDANSGTFLGYESGMNNSGIENTSYGFQSLKSNSSSNANTAIGYKALTNHVGLGCNTAIGSHAMVWNTSGQWNTAIGTGVMEGNISGLCNTAVGGVTLHANTSGECNVAFGYGAMLDNVSGSWNTSLGMNSLEKASTGYYNTAVGGWAGRNNANGSYNVFLGYKAGYNETGSNKLYIANSEVNPPLIYGDFSTGAVGIGTTDPTSALSSVTKLLVNGGMVVIPQGGSDRVAISPMSSPNVGYASFLTITPSDVPFNTGEALAKVQIQNASSSIPAMWIVNQGTGDLLGMGNSNSYGNSSFVVKNNGDVGIGTTVPAYKLDVVADAQINGVRVGRGSGNQASNVIIGSYALMTNSSGFANTAVGYYSLFSNTTGSTNTAIGQHTLYANTIGTWNTALGCQALTNNIDGNSNTALGLQSLGANTTGDNNTAVGRDALLRNTTGNNSVALGQEAGFNGISGSGNVFLGYQAGYNEYGSNKLYIANSSTATPLLYGDFSTGNVGLGTNTPTARLQIKPSADDLSLRIMSPASDARYISIYRGGNAGVINIAGDAMSNEPYLSLQVGGSEKMSIYNTGNVGIGTTIASTKLEVVGVITATGGNSTNWNTAYGWGNHAAAGYLTTEVDGSVTNELQVLSISNDTIRLTNGGFVKLPAGFDGDYNSLINTPTIPVVPTTVSAFTNDAGYLTSFIEVDGDVSNEIEMPVDANAGDMAYFDGSAWVKITQGNDNQILTLQAGIPTWKNQFALPTATSTVATNVTATTATLNSIVNANGLSTVVTFEYGPTTSYGTTISAIQSPVTGNVNTNVSADISGLVDGTTYYFRIKSENAIGIVYSTEMSFQFLSVGESYQGGIVAYILQAGDPGYDASIQHGIIAAPSDQSANAQWGCINSLLCSEITTEGMPIGKGNQNTMEIINGCPTLGIAARLCGDLVLGGYDDWFLPSYNELMQLYLNKSIIGGLSNAEYWSSSEGTSWYAYTLNFSNGAFGYPNKDFGHYVRAVRSF